MVAGTPVVPDFDDDGNMTHGPLPVSPNANSTLVWDAENRLIEVKNASSVTLVKYAYDALSRRISMRVGVSPTSSTLYLYDGWNRIAEYAGQELKKTYLWGMDLSGSMQGAGGVGGLLAVSEHSWSTGQTPVDTITSFYPTFDGNGNVSEYLSYTPDNTETPDVNEETCTVAAHFEYDPFGNLTADSEMNAETFPYRFSTKPQDPVTGLYYYGYRWYDPLTGRWPSRDPIEEGGGVNLYGFVGNEPNAHIDIIGNLRWEVLDPLLKEDDLATNGSKIPTIDGLGEINNGDAPVSGNAAGLTTIRLEIKTKCCQKEIDQEWQLSDSLFNYNVVVTIDKGLTENQKREAKWFERDHWIDFDRWFLYTAIPDSIEEEKILKEKSYTSQKVCESNTRTKFITLVIKTFNKAADDSMEKWDRPHESKPKIHTISSVGRTDEVEPRGIPAPSWEQ